MLDICQCSRREAGRDEGKKEMENKEMNKMEKMKKKDRKTRRKEVSKQNCIFMASPCLQFSENLSLHKNRLPRYDLGLRAFRSIHNRQ